MRFFLSSILVLLIGCAAFNVLNPFYFPRSKFEGNFKTIVSDQCPQKDYSEEFIRGVAKLDYYVWDIGKTNGVVALVPREVLIRVCETWKFESPGSRVLGCHHEGRLSIFVDCNLPKAWVSDTIAHELLHLHLEQNYKNVDRNHSSSLWKHFQ
jgi:hypothetical protein